MPTIDYAISVDEARGAHMPWHSQSTDCGHYSKPSAGTETSKHFESADPAVSKTSCKGTQCFGRTLLSGAVVSVSWISKILFGGPEPCTS